MSRAPSWLLLTVALLLGVVIGLLLDRPGRVVTAQATRATPGAAVVPAPSPKGLGEAALFDQLDRQYEQFEGVNRTFALAAKAVAPAVVHLVAKKSGRREDHRGVQYFEETGSGVIVRPGPGRELYVLTNNHVVEGADPTDIAITLHDGRVLRTDGFWTDRKADVAVIRLGRDDLPSARLGDSDALEIGSWVLALGSPFGLTHSVTHGIISARNRHETDLEDDGVENQEFLQTDAAINPGNSGGPLVNLKGEVVGINTAIASNGGGSEGVGFSIPVNLAKWIMGQLIAQGRVSRGALGVNLKDLDAEGARARGLDRPRGAHVIHVGENTPAAFGGIRAGDVVLRFDGTEVIDINHLINLVSRSPIGSEVEILVWRDGQAFAMRVAIAEQSALLAPAVGRTERPRPNAPLRRPPRPGPADAAAPRQPEVTPS